MKNLKYIFLSLLVALSLNGFAVNWVITDEGATIKVTHFAVEKYNSPKSDTQTKAVPSRTGDNTSGVDKLYIGNDNSYPCQIAWNDVTVSGDTPSDLEDFEDKVSTILNNVPAGSGDMDSATYDPAGYESQVTVKDIQRTLNQAQALLASSGSAITAGQGYIIDNGGVLQLPTGISLLRVRGINLPAGAKGFDPVAEAYITALATYVPCTYDVGTNKVSIKVIVYAINLTQTAGGTVNTVDKTFVNLLGETPVITKIDDGLINFNTTTFTFVEHQTLMHPVLIFDATDTQVLSPLLIFQDANNLRLRMTRTGDYTATDDKYNNTYLEFYILIAN